MRKTEFANGEYYHIYNRGTDKREVFLCEKDYLRFLTGMREFNREDSITSLFHLEKRRQSLKPPGGYLGSHPVASGAPLVSIICYCLNPNHYHLILRQEKEKGISKFMHKLAMGYTHYFNGKNKRSGSLFQGAFKSIHIDSNEYLLYLSAYVNANHFIHGYEDKERSDLHNGGLTSWPYCSYPDYVGQRNGKLCEKDPILGQFKDIQEYAKFIEDNANYLKDKKETEKYVLE